MSLQTGYQTENNVTHFLRKKLTYANAAGTYSLGWVPPEASILRGGVVVHTAFNAGTNNQLDIGYRNGGDSETDDTDEYATDLALGTPAIVPFDATAAVLHFPKGAEIVCVLDVTGTAAGTGNAVVWVEYIVDNDGDTTS